jgi:hypothetical protein
MSTQSANAIDIGIRKGVSQARDPVMAARELHDAIYQPNCSFAVFYCSPEYDLDALAKALHARFGDTPLIGCTTAGEITPVGYLRGALTGVSIASPHFRVATHRIDKLRDFALEDGATVAKSLLERLGGNPSARDTFGFLLVDGLSCREEIVVSAIARAVGGISIFGGSAGDGVRFQATHLYHEGRFHRDCALFSLVQTEHPFTVFKTQHFTPSDKKMVVTEADPERRVVTEINGAPAGHEYARMVGLDVDKLTPLIFSAYPVVVKVGNEHYVRSIQKVNEDESLTFFCAIDEGIVLTVAQGVDMVDNLRALFADVRAKVGPPQLVLGCDCILRHLEMDQKQLKDRIAPILVENNVIGFSTYGEQYNAMHVNQTFTGVAIGPLR